MTPVQFQGQTVVFAENQPEYLPLPAYWEQGAAGRVIFCWRLTWRERFAILVRGILWHEVLTFNKPLQPQLLSVEKPYMAVQG